MPLCRRVVRPQLRSDPDWGWQMIALYAALERFRAEDRNGATLWQNEIDEQLEAGTLDLSLIHI